MKYLDLTFDEPSANLACDEALLELMEADPSREDCLRIWQAKKHFVVLGHSNQLFSDVNVSSCRRYQIPVLRRMSGGGTVMQGPGCLSYSLFLRSGHRELKNIGDTFTYVLERHRRVVETLCGADVRIEGISDLAIEGIKFSGNAQYRKSRCVLVHGTFLLSFDLHKMEKCLFVPAKQPGYRRSRPHGEFVTNVPLDAAQLCSGLRNAWHAEAGSCDVPFERIGKLVRDRYLRSEWSEKF